jgi:hypothetical protein
MNQTGNDEDVEPIAMENAQGDYECLLSFQWGYYITYSVVSDEGIDYSKLIDDVESWILNNDLEEL